MSTSFGRQFFDRQMEYLNKNDIDGLVDNQYDEQAILVSFSDTIRGREALRQYFKGYVEKLGKLELKSIDNFVEIEDAIFFQATMDTVFGRSQVYDIFVFANGKATRHFTGVISVTPKPQV